MVSSLTESIPRISQASIQARNGFASTPAWPIPPRANAWVKRWVSARVTAAWPIQTCWLAQPSSGAAGRDRLAKQRPLRAIGRATGVGEIGGHVPPLDPELRMRTVIGGKGKCAAGDDWRKSFRASRRAPQNPARGRLAAEPARSAPPTKPRRVIVSLPLIGKDPDQARRLHARQSHDGKRGAATAAAIATPSSPSSCSGKR